MFQNRRENLAYVIGLAIGDGNLSNPNSRAVRLRITCDNKYPKLTEVIFNSIKLAMPGNKVSIIKKKANACDISCYSNKWEKLLGWQAKGGPKHKQNISIPNWIKKNKNYSINCLRGLLQTDGSIYKDRGYIMINFVTIIPKLANYVKYTIKKLGFDCQIYICDKNPNTKYTVRISKNADNFIRRIKFTKE
jgi:DNA-binding transcriptional regulator WhiA